MSRLLLNLEKYSLSQPQKSALVGAQSSLTYGALWPLVNEIAARLEPLTKGRPFALLADNGPAWIILDLAMMKLGVAALPLPPFFTDLQTTHALTTTGASLLIKEIAEESEADLTLLGQHFQLKELNCDPITLPEGTAKITFTSGTTGTPKGVCLSLASMEATASAILETLGKSFAKNHFSVMPLAVLLENVAGVYANMLGGGTTYILPQHQIGFEKAFQPDFGKLLTSVQQCRTSSMILVPELLRGFMAAVATSKTRLNDLMFVAVGGSRVAPDLLKHANNLGLPVYEGYGLSEAGSVIAINTPNDIEAGTVGRFLPHIHTQICNEGELLLTPAPFLGYVGAPQNAPQDDQDHYPTGDLVTLKDNGRLVIKGRKKNVLITGYGRNISPEWIESELLANPEIAQALVFGDAKPGLGAFIVPSSADVSPAMLMAAIARTNNRLPDYAHLMIWLPTSPFTPQNGDLTANGRLCRAKILSERNNMIDQAYTTASTPPSTTPLQQGPSPVDGENFYAHLMQETEASRHAFLTIETIGKALAFGAAKESYIAYLTEAYHHVKHTTSLMRAVKAKLPLDATVFHAAIDEYIEEEEGHEEWILNDIRNCGGDSEAVRHGQPSPETELMVAYAYDFIERINPVGFFGMVLVLEGTSTAIASQLAEKLMKVLNLPKKCFSYLFSHGALDLEHMKFFEDLMGKVTDPKDQQDIIHMARMMYRLFGNVLNAVPYIPLENTHESVA